MEDFTRNTKFNNLVNYPTNQSSAAVPFSFDVSSVDPNCLSNITKDTQLVEYKFFEDNNQ